MGEEVARIRHLNYRCEWRGRQDGSLGPGVFAGTTLGDSLSGLDPSQGLWCGNGI